MPSHSNRNQHLAAIGSGAGLQANPLILINTFAPSQ